MLRDALQGGKINQSAPVTKEDLFNLNYDMFALIKQEANRSTESVTCEIQKLIQGPIVEAEVRIDICEISLTQSNANIDAMTKFIDLKLETQFDKYSKFLGS